MDFGMLPPEINSARMYAGPGVGPMLAASAAWDALAVELHLAAASYGSVVSALSSGWMGPASASMAAASAPYVAWLHGTAAAAEQTGAQAKGAAAAYEVAFAMTVPPPVIAANRSLLMALVATNFFGQNTPAIAATEAHYAEMWAQDAAAMYGYAGSSAAASTLTPFTPVQPTTDPTGMAAQSSAVAHATGTAAAAQSTTLSHALSATPAALQQLAAPAAAPAAAPTAPPISLTSVLSAYNLELSATKIVNTVLSSTNAGNSERSILIANRRLDYQLAQDTEKGLNFGSRLVSAAPAGFGGSAASTASAGMGRAAAVGSLSVPPTWATAAPQIRSIAMALPDSGAGITSAASAQMPLVPGSAFSQSTLGTLSRQGFDGPRVKSKPVIVRTTATG